VLFPSIPFLFYFLPLLFIIYCVMPSIAAKNVFLLLASLLFYAWGEPRFVILLLGQIALNYGAALTIGANDGTRRSFATAIAVGLNLAMLGLFKYANFVIGTLNVALPAGARFSLPGLALPLGISFFTFHSISYLIDVHRRKVAANDNPL
jgi:alginate O-acetyltransferase complex protein AlgI